MAEAIGRYGLELPNPDILTRRFQYNLRYWRNRNKYIKDMREAVNGLNMIEAPTSVQYKVRVMHSYILASLINEKISRFLLRPNIQVIPDDELDDSGRAKSSRIEEAINVANESIESRSDADVWSRQILDAILLDEGVSKILRAPATFWSELVAHDQAIEKAEAEKREVDESQLIYPLLSQARDNYKKEKGIPITRVYVPLEYFYPTYDGSTLIESFEINERSMIAVMTNPLFQTDEGRQALATLGSMGPDGGISQTVNIIEYMNNNWHCYYLCGRGANSGKSWPKVSPNSATFNGQLLYLYGYEHGLGRSQYNPMGGRYGGWKTNDNRIEGVGKGLLELNQAADEILSQVLTNVRAKYWPSLNFQLDPEQRGFGPADTKPVAPTLKEGEAIVTFKGEEIKPIFLPDEDPMAMWLYNKIEGQVSKLGGSAVLFGERLPGVDTGYHQALQQTSAESLDEKLNQNISRAAQQDANILMLHVKKIGEPVFMHYAEVNELTGKKKGRYVSLDPADLTPLPRVDAQVQKPRPVDYITSLRAAAEASDDRNGKGPLLSDDTIHEKILGTEHYDVEKKKIIIESQKREIINSGVLSSKIGERLNLKLAKAGVPEISPELLAKADPALLAAIKQGQGMAEVQGGIDPKLLSDMASQGGMRQPGPSIGDPEAANRLGEAIQNNMRTGAAI